MDINMSATHQTTYNAIFQHLAQVRKFYVTTER